MQRKQSSNKENERSVDYNKDGTGGSNKKATLKEFVIALRPWSFTASVVAVLLGSSVAWKHSQLSSSEERFSFVTFVLTMVGALSIHAAGNLTNTYFDYRSGLDQKKTAGDRTLFDTNVRPKQVLALAIGFYLISLLVGNYFVYRTATATRGNMNKVGELLGVCFLGGLLAFFYTAGPVRLKHRALGDVAIFLCFGPLLVEGTYFLQRFQFSFQTSLHGSTTSSAALWLSVPIGCVTEAILHVNNARDVEADTRAHALTVARLLGPKLSVLAFVGLIWGPYLLLALYCAFFVTQAHNNDIATTSSLVALLKEWALFLLPLVAAPMTVPLLRSFSSARWSGNDLCASTGQFGFLFGLLLSLSVLISPPF
eukprot:TRINITY_DN534_c0_g3_i2.p1 TRINITY_DN534_c0_g3~~TRINITY_DN534_c0_g3_i2.p1  ORF type:complete len:382 (-),score=56.24 TRINITY_DN534_c0_g3_i2:151-1254(-)